MKDPIRKAFAVVILIFSSAVLGATLVSVLRAFPYEVGTFLAAVVIVVGSPWAVKTLRER